MTVQIDDINDNYPLFESPGDYIASIKENNPIGTIIDLVSDFWVKICSFISRPYTVCLKNNGSFINSLLYLDFIFKTQFTLCSIWWHSSYGIVAACKTNANFDLLCHLTRWLPLDVHILFIVQASLIQATDPDFENNGTSGIVYNLEDISQPFNIDIHTGVITLNSTLDFETHQLYNLIVSGLITWNSFFAIK